MLNRLNRNIKVLVERGDATNSQTLYIARYHCSKCKNIFECPNPAKCHFVSYIRERQSNTRYVITNDVPILRVFVTDEPSRQRAMNVIHRAQRLRSNRFELHQKTL